MFLEAEVQLSGNVLLFSNVRLRHICFISSIFEARVSLCFYFLLVMSSPV